jgi:hypothetical protein
MLLTRMFATSLANSHASYGLTIATLQMVVCAGHAWQAWLLFGRGWRSGVWTLLPLLVLVVPKSFLWVQVAGILIPCVEAALLVGVRQRPWAWVLAAVAQMIFAVLVSLMLNAMTLGWHALVPVSLPQLSLPATSALWLLTQMAAACILAFSMPLSAGETTSASPPRLPPAK